MVDRVAAIIEALKADPPALPDDEVAEAVLFLEWLRDDNFTFLGVRDYRLDAGRGCPRRRPRFLSRRPARRRRRGDHHRRRPDRDVAAGAGGVQRAPAAPHHQDQRALAGAPAGGDGPRRGQALRPRRPAHRRISDRRPVHLDGLYPLDPQHSLSAPQGRQRPGACRLQPQQPFRQARSPTCWTPIRATSCSRSTRRHCSTSRRSSCSSANGRACGCCRATTGSSASSPSWSMCRASRTAAVRVPPSAGCWRPRSTATSRRSSRTSRKAPWSACISSSRALTVSSPIRTAPGSNPTCRAS